VPSAKEAQGSDLRSFHRYERVGRGGRSQPLIHGDETTVQVLKEKDKEATSTSYMWAYRSGQSYCSIISPVAARSIRRPFSATTAAY